MKLNILDYHVVTSFTGTTQVVASIEGLSVGDILVAHTYARDDFGHAPISAPAGWTQLDARELAGTMASYLYYKVATATDIGATFTFTCGASDRERFVVVVALTGAYSSDPRGTDTGDLHSDDTDITLSSLTPDMFEHILLLFACNENSGSTYTTYSCATDNPTWTEVYDSALGGGRTSRRFFAYGKRQSASATGNIVLNQTDAYAICSHAVIINSGNDPKVMFIV